MIDDTESLAELMREMVDSEAWQCVEGYIKGRIEDHKNQLMTCQMDEVVKHRAKVEAYGSVLLHVQSLMAAGQS